MAYMWGSFPYTNFHELNLDYILKIAKYAQETSEKMLAWRTQHEREYKELLKHVNALQAWIDGIEKGDIPEELINGLGAWLDANLESLIGKSIKFVWFGLTEDGYFAAYIPEKWQELTFDTIMNFDNEYYGHLLICYDDAELKAAETYYGSSLNIGG